MNEGMDKIGLVEKLQQLLVLMSELKRIQVLEQLWLLGVILRMAFELFLLLQLK
jgi:hypothetical protein